jgi:hypothetical protein
MAHPFTYIYIYTNIHRVLEKGFYNGIPNVTVW